MQNTVAYYIPTRPILDREIPRGMGDKTMVGTGAIEFDGNKE